MRNNPWDKISQPNQLKYNFGDTIDVELKNILWARDVNNSCGLVMLFKDNFAHYIKGEHQNLDGISMEYTSTDDNAYSSLLFIKLKDIENLDIFYSFCLNIIQKVKNISSYEKQMIITLNHLMRWKNLFNSASSKLLSANAIQGLFCELTFLEELLNNNNFKEIALVSWVGPDQPPAPQDFIYNNTAVDIKSLLGDERKKVKISSEDQLDSQKDNLYLKIYSISKVGEDDGLSLNQMVGKIYGLLTDEKNIDLFDSKLSTINYMSNPKYDEDYFKMNIENEKNYKVAGDFPSLKKTDLASVGIENVSYSIRLDAIEPFLCDRKDLLE
ncbi:PD-(D/E)XK motif protein [Gammaproteobacteria bacterium]|nr:PD-(D/E)XK motif protein [Gammaproteobacteria bacterium]